jgi:uncharacterized protein (DUF934 family)
MRHILRQREGRPDEWRYLGEERAAAGGLIVPLAELRVDPARWLGLLRPLGVRLAPADPVETLREFLPQLALVALEFPTPGEGRGYSQARVLRERLGFAGELRAVGAAVRQDLLFLLRRCGVDAFELAPGEDLTAALAALQRYDVAYQPGAGHVRQQRFYNAAGG